MLQLSALIVRDRETGSSAPLEFGDRQKAFVVNIAGGMPVSDVAAAQSLILGNTPEGIAAREKYSHALFIIDNGVRGNWEFPSAAEQAEKQRGEKLNAARSAQTKAAHAKQAADAALEAYEKAKLDHAQAVANAAEISAKVPAAPAKKSAADSEQKPVSETSESEEKSAKKK